MTGVYRLVGRLEASELSELYRAERDGGGTVVLKLFHPKTTDLEYARVIGDVAQQLRLVSHPGIARVLHVGLYERRLAIVREDAGRYTLGQALTRLNTREVVLPPAVAIAFVVEVAGILEAANASGVVHGALTPGNVLLGSDGAASVADFGALRALLASPGLRKAFGGRGRASYRAPELKAAAEGTVASDVYALGAMAYELLTLKEPSIGRDALSTRQAEKLPPPSRLVRRLHSRIDPIVMRALDPSASRRQRSCGELADGLRDFLAAQGGVPGRADVRKFVEELFPRDVVVSALGAVPSTRPFELEPIEGVSALVASLELPEADDRRPPFSGGAVDARTGTPAGFPIFGGPDEETNPGQGAPADAPPEAARGSGAVQQPLPVDPRETLRMGASVGAPAEPRETLRMDGSPSAAPRGDLRETAPLSVPAAGGGPVVAARPEAWDAPPGPLPVVRASSPAPPAIERRVRLVEDYAVVQPVPVRLSGDGAPPGSDQTPVESGPRPARPSSERKAAKTLVSFTAPFQRDSDELPPDWRQAREQRRRAGVQAVRGGAAILTIVTVGLVGLWLLRSSDPVGDFISWLPAPIEVELQALRRPKGLAVPGPKAPLPVELPDFDAPSAAKAPASAGPQSKATPAPTPRPAAPPLAAGPGDCHAPPPAEAPTAYLTVEAARLSLVKIDGRRVCGAAVKVPVSPGSHLVEVNDPRTKQSWRSTVRLEAGKQAKFEPSFR